MELWNTNAEQGGDKVNCLEADPERAQAIPGLRADKNGNQPVLGD
jgi:hypothetical protein